MVTVVAIATGAQISGSVGDLLEILVIAIMLNFAATLFASGLAMRFRTLQAAPLIQLPAFLIIMTAPVYVPRNLIEGWVGTVAEREPDDRGARGRPQPDHRRPGRDPARAGRRRRADRGDDQLGAHRATPGRSSRLEALGFPARRCVSIGLGVVGVEAPRSETQHMGKSVRIRFIHAAGLVIALGLVAAAPASAVITPTTSAPGAAGAMSDSLAGGELASSTFPVFAAPPAHPAATADSSLAGFPTSGDSFSILSSGDATLAGNGQATFAGVTNGSGNGGHGTAVQDLVTLRLNLNVPASANCFSIDFRFLSEEYPTFVGSSVNDGFVAELDTSDFQGDGNAVTAPHNFAFDEGGNVISVNTAGISAANAAGTVYGGGTSLLRASTPVSPGLHSVYLSVFDQGDSNYDSAAFLDRAVMTNTPPSVCKAGVSSDVTPPDTTITDGPKEGRDHRRQPVV